MVVEGYVPGPGDDWERRQPGDAGFDPAALEEAIAFINASETTRGHDQRVALDLPDNEIVGPLKERGGVNGLVLRDGYIVAEWGDTARVDMTYSISKSYLSTVAGLALDRGLIRDVDDLVAEYARDDDAFTGDHNAKITWRHLLQQSSEWVGTLWGKRDIADRRKGVDREIHEPGTFYEYNDVRVNLLSWALLQVWRRPLPEVLREHVMDPIGASDTWEWHGYSTSWVEIDGQRMQSVSGGGHFGGGVWINSRDHARFGLLFARRGNWGGNQLLSEAFIDAALTPSACEPIYGYMWWLNPEHKQWSSLPEASYAARGAGSNIIWVDPETRLVVVLRWIEGEAVEECLARVLRAVK
jgi:CubicO group peptidase (beta-lactamase class C family)